MIMPQFFLPLSLLLLRLMVAIIFFASGYKHATHAQERAESIGLPVGATIALGIVEMAASIMLIIGLYCEIAGGILILVMLGAIGKKIFVWHKKFFEEEGYGWHYDLFLIVANLVIMATLGGTYTII